MIKLRIILTMIAMLTVNFGCCCLPTSTTALRKWHLGYRYLEFDGKQQPMVHDRYRIRFIDCGALFVPSTGDYDFIHGTAGCFPGTTTPLLPPERYYCKKISNYTGTIPFSFSTQCAAVNCFAINQIKPQFNLYKQKFDNQELFDNFTEYFGYNIGLKANKSFFFFGRYVVAVGSGISCDDSDYNIITTIFQNQLNDKTIDLFSCSDPKTMNLFPIDFESKSKLIIVDSSMTGYYIPEGNPVRVIRKKMAGSQAVPGNPDSFARKASKTEIAYFDHGDDPGDAGYEYYVMVNSSLRKMIDFADRQEGPNPRFKVLAKNKSAHVVRDYQQAVTAYAIFDDDTSGLPEEVYGASSKSIIFCRKIKKDTLLTISWQDKDTIKLAIRGKISLSDHPQGLIAVKQEKLSNGKYLTFIKLNTTNRKSVLRYRRIDPSTPYHKP